MKLETIKTFILTILIGISLLLSIIIWTYQPNHDPIQSNYVSEVDIGGDEMKKRTIIQPTSLLFHVADQSFGFREASERSRIYEEMQQWLLTDMSLTKQPNIHDEHKSVELTFPLSMPLEAIPYVFHLDKNFDLPNWSFEKVTITFNESDSTLNVYFMATNGEDVAHFIVSESDAYSQLATIVGNVHRLKRYVPLGSEQDPIYLPEKNIKMQRRSLAIEDIEPELLVNALFSNPSLVNYTIGEKNYNDGQRGMTVLNDGRSMDFINPIHSDEDIPFLELINLSIDKINEHKGWTNDYILTEFNQKSNRLQYQLFYDGYPVFSHRNYSMIEQKWQDQDLHQYKRPLFKLTNLLESSSVTLPSGEEVIQYLTEDSSYEIENIKDIQIGYRLKYVDAPFSVVLEPTWYIDYKGRWLELRMNESDTLEDGDG